MHRFNLKRFYVDQTLTTRIFMAALPGGIGAPRDMPIGLPLRTNRSAVSVGTARGTDELSGALVDARVNQRRASVGNSAAGGRAG